MPSARPSRRPPPSAAASVTSMTGNEPTPTRRTVPRLSPVPSSTIAAWSSLREENETPASPRRRDRRRPDEHAQHDRDHRRPHDRDAPPEDRGHDREHDRERKAGQHRGSRRTQTTGASTAARPPASITLLWS